jgi:hypothetical protein
MMRTLAGSLFAAGAFTAILVSAAQASSMHVEPDRFKSTQNFALRPGSATFGLMIIEGYRTVDGKNFYNDDARPKVGGAGLGGFFATTPDNNADSRAAFSFSPSGSNSFFHGSFGGGDGGGIVGGGGGAGGGGGSSGSGASRSGFSVGAGPSLNGLNPLQLGYTSLANKGGPELSEGGGGRSEVSATPLPPSWTLMLIGLVGFGCMAHRLRKNERVGEAI